ncbi:hypothetical protein ACJX0J_033288, partial [Zea mays]
GAMLDSFSVHPLGASVETNLALFLLNCFFFSFWSLNVLLLVGLIYYNLDIFGLGLGLSFFSLGSILHFNNFKELIWTVYFNMEDEPRMFDIMTHYMLMVKYDIA